MSNFQLYKKTISATGTTTENEPIIKSDGASSDVMEWQASTGTSKVEIREDASNNLKLEVDGIPVASGLAGIDGTGLHFDGAAGNIDIASPPDLGTKFSFELIIQADSIPASDYAYIVDFGNGGRFALTSIDGVLAIYDTDERKFTGATFLDDLKVHHLVVTVDGTSAIAYDNGNQVGTATLGAISDIDDCADARIGTRYDASGYFFDGTLYRTRFWNKTLTAAEVTASYENATVPFADQYGSQTNKIAASVDQDWGTDVANLAAFNSAYAWTGHSATSLTVSSKVLQFSTSGANTGMYYNAGLTAGNRYRVVMRTGTISGTTFKAYTYASGYTEVGTLVASTTNVFDFVAESSLNGYLYIYASTGDAATIQFDASSVDNEIVEIGVVSDYDLAFANPTQSDQVQDRAGAADGTSSATGVVQVTPIEQVNTNKLAVGGTTPLVGIGLAAGVTPTTLLDINESTSGDVYPLVIRNNNAGGSEGVGIKFHIANTLNAGAILMDADAPYGSAAQADATMQFFTSLDNTLVQRMEIDSVGKVGVNTAPAGTFHTVGLAGTTALMVVGASGNNIANFYDSSSAAKVTIDSAGNVGIGVTPSEALHIYRSGAVNAEIESNTDNAALIINSNTDNVGRERSEVIFQDNSVTKWTVGVQENSYFHIVDAARGGSSFTIRDAADMLLMESGGNLGVGTASVNRTASSIALTIGDGTADNYRSALELVGSEVTADDAVGRIAFWNVGGSGGQIATILGNRQGADNSGALLFQTKNAGTNGTRFTITPSGGVYETNGVLKENLLTNSGFDVWSNSTLEDVATVDADTMASDDTGDWTGSASATLAFDTDHYELATSATNQSIETTFSALTTGKLYEFSLDVKDGTASSQPLYFHWYYSGSANGSSPTFTTTSSFVTHTWVFEATGAAAAAYIKVSNNMSGSNVELKNFTLKEVTPGIVSGTAGPDGWARRGSCDLYRQHNDATLTKDGSFYSLKGVGSETLWQTHWPTVSADPLHIARFAGKTVTFGAWVYSTLATPEVLLRIDDGGTSDSTQTVAQNTWTWLECTKTISTSAGATFQIAKSGATAETFYVSQVCLVFGSAIGAGNYSRPMGEIVWLDTKVTSQIAATISSAEDLNVEVDTNGKLPKGAKAVDIIYAGSNAVVEQYLLVADSALKSLSQVANVQNANAGWVPLESDTHLSFTPQGTWNELSMQYHGVQLQ